MRTSACLGSVRLDLAQDDLRFVRTLQRGAAKSFLFGSVKWNGAHPLAGVAIFAHGAEREYRTITGVNGEFVISPVVPGKYEIRAALAGYVGDELVHVSEVHDRGCAAVNLRLWTDGRISGRLRHSTGAVAPNVTAELAILDENEELGERFAVETDEDGHFEFSKLAAGRYILGVNLEEPPSAEIPYTSTRYPGPILLAEGEKLSDADLRLPPRLPERTIHVQAVWPDG